MVCSSHLPPAPGTMLDVLVDSLALASAFAAQAALLIPTLEELGRESLLLLDAVVDAVRTSDPDLGDGQDTESEPDTEETTEKKDSPEGTGRPPIS